MIYEISDISNLSQMNPIADTCYLSAILKADSKVVISFSKRANPFHRVCLFCNFARNTVYVLEVEMLEPVVLARYRQWGSFVISWRYHKISTSESDSFQL